MIPDRIIHKIVLDSLSRYLKKVEKDRRDSERRERTNKRLQDRSLKYTLNKMFGGMK